MKKVFSLLLTLALVLSLSAPAFAATKATREEAAQVLAALDIMTGDQSGDLNLGASVTRAEFTKLAVSASPLRDGVGPETATSPYPDVPRTHWAAGYIHAAVQAGLVRGDLYGNFNPAKNITLAEGVTMVLRLLGYQDSDFTGAYPTGQMALYRTLKLDTGVTATRPTDPLNRENALFLFFNLLTAKTKDGSVYLNLLKPGDKLVNAAGDIDQVALVNAAMEGPIVAQGAWQAKIPFDVGSAKVYRAGKEASLSAVLQNDVLYYSKSMRTVWAYNGRVTGPLQAVAPASNPTSVTVAGKEYDIATTEAAYALSDLGPFRVGDSVTLLLGRDNQVASVLTSAAAQANGGDVVGLVTSVTQEKYTDASGNDYTASTVNLTATDGQTYAYRWDKANLRPGAVVRVTTANGGIELKSLSSAGLSGQFSSDGKRFDDYTLAADVEILDTYGSQAVRVYPDRLSGLKLEQSSVRYYLKNAQGELSRIILKDVTGDMHQYGVLTTVNEMVSGMTVVGSYVYDVGGKTGTVPGMGGAGDKVYNVKMGPFMLKTDGGSIDKMANLTELRLTSVDGQTAISANQRYTISDQAAVYVLRDGKYLLSSLGVVTDGTYTLTGWYDKAESQGGRIRVIIAQA